jgi:hypothetical protein
MASPDILIVIYSHTVYSQYHIAISIAFQWSSLGTWEPRNMGTWEHGNMGIWEHGNTYKGTREQGNKGTREQGNKGTREQGNGICEVVDTRTRKEEVGG